MSIEVERYESYKDSGIEWLGEIPSHWCVGKLKHSCYVQNGYAFESRDFISSGVPVIKMNNIGDGLIDTSKASKVCDSKKYSKFKLSEGDILIGMSGSLDNIGIVKSVNLPCVLNQRVGNIKVKDFSMIMNRYLWYIILSDLYKKPLYLKATGTAQLNISTNDILRTQVVYPSLKEQEEIANYLDKKVSAIDSVIAKKQKLIENLKLSKQALITETVTKGLDDTVPMKGSGVEWIGEIPSHWNVGRFKNVCEFLRGYSFPSNSLDFGTPYVSAGEIKDGKVYVDENKQTNVKLTNRYIIKEGDLLYCVTGSSLGGIGFVSYLNGKTYYHVNTCKVITNSKMIKKYIYYVLKSDHINNQIRGNSTGSVVFMVSVGNIRDMYLSVPPIDEQHKIAEYLDKKVGEFDKLISLQEQSIENLKLTKQKLITEVVTGKVNVQNLV